jgi:hypothetical protein
MSIRFVLLVKMILKASSSPTSNSQLNTTTTLPQGQILQTADGQFIILQSTEQHQTQSTQYVQVGGQSKRIDDCSSNTYRLTCLSSSTTK